MDNLTTTIRGKTLCWEGFFRRRGEPPQPDPNPLTLLLMVTNHGVVNVKIIFVEEGLSTKTLEEKTRKTDTLRRREESHPGCPRQRGRPSTDNEEDR